MKFILLILVVAVLVSGWESKHFDRFDGWSKEKLKNYFGVHVIHGDQSRPYDAGLPGATQFDGRTQWPGCDWAIKDQGQCGSCWSFGLSESFADVWCIANGQKNIILSAQDAVSCDSSDYGCNGGYMDRSENYLKSTGIVTWDCFPYVSGDGRVPACPYKCQNGADWNSDKHKSSSYTHVTGVANIQSWLQKGPCDIAFEVPNSFFSYSSGVFDSNCGGPFVGGHAVKMLGYGHDDSSNLDYWIIANSWGTGWGMNGYFWILKGKDCCYVEDNVFCSTA
jgi:cathepsin B